MSLIGLSIPGIPATLEDKSSSGHPVVQQRHFTFHSSHTLSLIHFWLGHGKGHGMFLMSHVHMVPLIQNTFPQLKKIENLVCHIKGIKGSFGPTMLIFFCIQMCHELIKVDKLGQKLGHYMFSLVHF